MVLALFVTSSIFLVSYLFVSLYLYKKDNAVPFNMRNHFPFEIYSPKHRVNGIVNIVLFLAFAMFFTNFISLLFYDLSLTNVLMVVLAFLISACSIILFYLPVAREKVHFTVSLLLAISSVMINALFIFIELRMVRLYEEKLFIIPIVISGLLILTYLFFIVHPRLFNLEMKRDENGNQIRPKYFIMSLFEWVLIISIFISQISLLFIDILG